MRPWRDPEDPEETLKRPWRDPEETLKRPWRYPEESLRIEWRIPKSHGHTDRQTDTQTHRQSHFLSSWSELKMQICKDYLNHTLDLTLSTPGLVCCCVDMIIIHGVTWLLTPGLSGILSPLLTLAARIQTHNLPHIASHCHKLGLGQEKKIGNRTRPFVIKEEGTFLTFKLITLSARIK